MRELYIDRKIESKRLRDVSGRGEERSRKGDKEIKERERERK